MDQQIAIIDYGMGNLTSVINAFLSLRHHAVVAHRPAELVLATHVVLPGVGAFADGMQKLQKAGWLDMLETEVRQKAKPFLGICLGMQLLASTGTEHGTHAGLNWIPGVVEKLKPTDPDFRVPHIGWNDVHFRQRVGIYAGLGESDVFYFVHSYAVQTTEPSIVTGMCFHGTDFVASVQMGNILGTQYHPEKSHKAGLKVLDNFAKMVG